MVIDHFTPGTHWVDLRNGLDVVVKRKAPAPAPAGLQIPVFQPVSGHSIGRNVLNDENDRIFQ